MPTIIVREGGCVFQWAGGSFIAIWDEENAGQHVPDDMLQVPEYLVKSRIGQAEIVGLAKAYVS